MCVCVCVWYQCTQCVVYVLCVRYDVCLCSMCICVVCGIHSEWVREA